MIPRFIHFTQVRKLGDRGCVEGNNILSIKAITKICWADFIIIIGVNIYKALVMC